jgi:hypothetical protein
MELVTQMATLEEDPRKMFTTLAEEIIPSLV